jgi:hypothetical protein
MSKVYLIETSKLKENSIIENTVDEKLIRITLQNVQDTILQPLLTAPLFKKILEGAQGDTLTPEYRQFILEYVHPVLIAGVTLNISDNLIYKYTAMGVNKESAESSQTINSTEHSSLKKEKERILIFHSNALQDYLEKNRSKFPEFESDNTESEDGIDIGFYLG